MSQHATFDDANLILRLYEIRREERLREARRWFARNFGPATLTEYRAICTPGTDEDVASEVSLEPYDLSDDPEAEDWAGEGKVTSLAPLAAALRRQDEVKGVLDALARVRAGRGFGGLRAWAG
jgi:hypothetical protein